MHCHFWTYSAAALIASALIMAPAFSQGKGKGKGHDKHDQGDDEGKHGKYEFGEHDREVITHYYSSRGSNLPRGWRNAAGTCRRGSRNNWSGTARFRQDCRNALNRAQWN
jgi:hypothetical protein